MLEAASISGEGEEETPRMESDSWRKGEEECRDLECGEDPREVAHLRHACLHVGHARDLIWRPN